MGILRAPLNSSMLAHAEYDSDNQTLTLSFHNGRDYTYESVPEEEFAALAAAPSPGRYYISAIKDQYNAR